MFVASDGAHLFYKSWGAGKPVVFLHGWGVSSAIWQYQMLALSTRFRCIAYDKRGHGLSDDTGTGYDYEALASDLAALLTHLDLHDVTLVGHSMGPAEIVRYLSRYGAARISKLAFISSALPFILLTPDNPNGVNAAVFAERRKKWIEDMPSFLTSNARELVLPNTSEETVAWIANMGQRASLKGLIDLNHAITETDFRTEVTKINTPTLVIHGAEDKSAPLELTGKRLATSISGSRLKIYDAAPHALLVTHQHQLNQDLLAWVGG